MKKAIITTIITALTLTAVPVLAAPKEPVVPVITETVNENLYPLTGIVTDIDTYEEYDVVTIVCGNGNMFQFSAPTTDCWDLYDLATCIMNNNGTDYVEDDQVLSALYAGSIEQLQANIK